MKLTRNEWLLRCCGWMGLNLMVLGLLAMALGRPASAQAVSTTTVQGTVYLANGQAGSGTLVVSWPAFTTANGQAIAADSTTVTIATDGFVSINLAPNLGATPAGLYYTAVFYMSDGSTSTQYWVVPSAAQASLSQVQAQLMPAEQAVQTVSKAYVDQSIAELSESLLTASGGTLSGPLYLSGDPTQPLQAADKHYVDESVALDVPLAGGNMTGPLTTPAVNGVQSPQPASSQTTLQAAVSAAGTNGAMEIPPNYAGTDRFTNPNGIYVADLRQTSSQQFERSVKEFGAVCDGVTDDTNALQTAINYAQTHGVSLTIPQGICKTRALNWHGESIGGMGKQVSALMGFPGQDVLSTVTDSTNLLSYTRIHDLTIYVDQSEDVSCMPAEGRAPAGSCAVNRPMESNSIFSPGGNGLNGTVGTGAAWSVGNCAIAMPAVTGAGGNGLRVAEIENVEIVATGVDPMAAQYPGAHSTHTCGLYLAQWPQWSEFRNIDIRGLNTGIAIPALPGAAPAGLTADSNRWQNITIQATHGFTAAAGSNNVLDNVVALAANSSATGEPPTGLALDLASTQQGWTVRNAVVLPSWNAVQPALTVTAAGGAVTGVSVGTEHGLGFDPYGTQVPLAFSGSCTAQATASVNTNGSIGTVTVTAGGVGCSGTTTASINVAGTWDTAAPVNLIGGTNMAFFGGNLLKGNGGYTVWNAASSESYETQLDGGGGTLPGGGSYQALVANTPIGTAYQVDQFPGADFGAKLQACLGSLSTTYGGTCDARNFTGTQSMGSSLTISTANATVLLPCATISTANQVIVTAGTRNVTLRGCALRGASAASGSQGGTVFLYSGANAMVQVGDPTYASDTMGLHMDNAVINTTASSSATAKGLVAYRTQELDLESLYFLGNSNQTGMTLDGTGNYTGGSFFSDQFSGFQTAVNAIGHQVSNPATTDWMNASTFVRLHIDCPTSGGNPIAGTYGINLQQGDGNTFTGGDVEGCSTALHLGANAQNNTIVGLRNESSTNQVVADAGSSYNNWMSGGTMFTGQLTDNGTRNSFLDTFHRSFNGMNGDWYGSQQDATVTNHYRLGIGSGNERGLLSRYQTDYGYRWTMGLSDATAGEQFYQILDELNNVYRLSIGQYNNGQSSTNNQTVINAAGTGAVVLNGSNNSGTGGVVIGSGGASETTVATINNQGNAQFNGTLQVGGTSTFINTPTVKNQANAEIDATLWAGLSASQKESFSYKDYNGNSQWYMVKDASNNWALNSATGGLDSFKAYQSTNSGDTYINASNSTGVVRINYETGSGTGFNIYGGSSSALYASFTGTNSIKFPGLAASSGENCLQIDNSGYITNTGSACGSGSGGGGSGTVNSGSAGQIAYYTATGTVIGGTNTVPVTAGGTGASTASAALTNLGGAPLTGAAFTGAITAPSTNGAQTVPPGGNIQAAINAAGSNGVVTLTPGTLYTVSATLTIPYSYFIFNGNGACILTTAAGDGISIAGASVTLNQPCLMPGGASTGAAIHDAGGFGTTINSPMLVQQSTHVPSGGYYWYYGIQVDADELFMVNNYDQQQNFAVFGQSNTGYGTLRCDSTFCGSGIYNPGYSVPVTSIVGSSGTYTFTTASGSFLNWNVVGGIVHVTGSTGGTGNFNAYYTITAVTSNTTFTAVGFNYDGLPTGSGTATGGTASTSLNAAVGYINGAALSMGCYGNAIDWEGGNDLSLTNVIMQSYNQFGLRVNKYAQGGSGNITANGVHNEGQGCANPALNGIVGNAGWIINNGANLKMSNATGGGGVEPVFPNSDSGSDGAENYAYYEVIHSAGGNTTTQPLPIGYTYAAAATLGGSDSVVVTAPTSTGATDTCDFLRVDQTVNGRVSPFSSSGLNYAIPGEQGVACGPSAGSYISFTDNTPTSSLTAYSFSNASVYGSYGPALNNWPGTMVLTGTSNGGNLSTFDGACGIGPVFVVPAWPSYYQVAPNITCEGPTEDDWSGNITPYGSSFQNRLTGYNYRTNLPSALQLPLSGGYEGMVNAKGAINFGTPKTYGSGATDVLTIIDSNPFKTLSTPGNRPVVTQAADAADTAIGLDGNHGLAFRDPNSADFYIDHVFDGSSYVAQLTASTALFKEANFILSGLSGLPSSGNYCLQIGPTGAVTPTGSACGSGGDNVSSSGTPASGQIAEWVSSTAVAGVTPTGTGAPVMAISPTLVTPTLGAAKATSLIATGVVDGEAPVTIVTSAAFIFGTTGGTYSSGYYDNENSTASTAITGTLPAAAAGLQYCVDNLYNGSAPDTGALTIQTSGPGQYIVYTDGTLSASGGYVISGGAARDSACVRGVDSTHWVLYVYSGTWTKH